VDLEAALEEFFEAQVAVSAADRELKAFLEGAKVADLGPDLYASEVTRRREALREATEALPAGVGFAGGSDRERRHPGAAGAGSEVAGRRDTT
jgi:hypothetical protein